MTKRLIEVDDDKLDTVRALLGTCTLKATVDEAFDEVLPSTSAAGPCCSSGGSSLRTCRSRDPARRVGLRPYYLGDTSALARLRRPEVAVRLTPLLESGLVARCTPTDLEASFSSTSPASHRAVRRTRSSWPSVELDQAVLDRAVAVQDALAERSQQRAAKIADLLITAVAKAARLVVLHYDYDFDLIAKITGQPTEWIVPAGTVS